MAALFPLPFLGIVGNCIPAMTGQLFGFRQALIESFLALGLLAVTATFIGVEISSILGLAIISWGILLILGNLVGRTRSMTLAIQGCVVLALSVLLIFQILLGDPQSFWQPILESIYSDLAVQGLNIDIDINAQAAIASSALITGMLIGTLFSLLLGSRLASIIAAHPEVEPFSELRLGYFIGSLAVFVALASIFSMPTSGALLLFGTAFMFQGVAVLIWWSKLKSWPSLWWLGLIALALILPSMFLLITITLSIVGFIDNWYGLRRQDYKF
ncbi:MAG: hypothetical protein VYA80_08280 [Pseudomonadota bacterium]|nr:hypothetical protein [Pseudomonadota bacterium]